MTPCVFISSMFHDRREREGESRHRDTEDLWGEKTQTELCVHCHCICQISVSVPCSFVSAISRYLSVSPDKGLKENRAAFPITPANVLIHQNANWPLASAVQAIDWANGWKKWHDSNALSRQFKKSLPCFGIMEGNQAQELRWTRYNLLLTQLWNIPKISHLANTPVTLWTHILYPLRKRPDCSLTACCNPYVVVWDLVEVR